MLSPEAGQDQRQTKAKSNDAKSGNRPRSKANSKDEQSRKRPRSKAGSRNAKFGNGLRSEADIEDATSGYKSKQQRYKVQKQAEVKGNKQR